MSKASLRPATGADHGHYARFFAELGTQDPVLEQPRWERECAPSTAFLIDDGREVGYAFWEAAGENVHVRHVVVDAGHRRRGLGRRLMLELAVILRTQGARAWRLNVMASNEVAIGLYASLGLRAIYSTAVLRLEWDDLARLPREPGRHADADPRFDGANETGFALMRGQLALAREKQGVRIVTALAENEKCMGIAVFDPHFPGAFPFRCKSAEYARTLVEGMRERYAGEASYVQVVIEDAAGIVRVLEAAGAQRVHDIVHMRGPIPQ